jgi:sugar lactone lactonase YvrE
MECIADVRAVLGEGPAWVEREQAIYWVDIPERRLFRWSADEGTRVIDPGVNVCSIAPRTRGGYVGAGYDGFFEIDADHRVTLIGDPEPDLPDNRFNDGKVDASGRFWAGTMDRHEQAASGSLYRLDPDLRWTRVDTGYRVTNGPAFSRDGRTLYHTDSARQVVYAFDLAGDGSASNRRVHLQFKEGDGYPDGMTVDAEDCLWIAFWDGWCVRRFSPAGERIAEIAVPAQRPTSVAFGGPAYDQMFITTASRDLSEDEMKAQPQAGGLFMTRPGVQGVPEPSFAG